MSVHHTGAVSAAAYLVVLLLVVFLPGAALAGLLRLRGLAVVGLAAPLSISIVAGGGVLAQKAAVRWTDATYVGCCVLALAAAALAGFLLRRGPIVRDRRAVTLGALAGGLVAAGTVAVSFRLAVGSLRSVPAQPDAMYHLNQMQHMLSTGSISSLTASGLLYDHTASFYPAAFHGVAVTALHVVTIELPIAANLLALVTGALVWTTGCLLLARQVFGAHGVTLAAAGVLSASFTAFPYLLSGYGVVWPNLLGNALVPALLGCVLSALGLARQDLLGRGRALVCLLAGLPGLALAHPNSFFTLVLLSFTILLVEAPLWAWRRRRTRPGAALLVAAALVSIPVLWAASLRVPKIHNVARFYAHPPDESVRRAGTEIFLNNPRYGAPLWVAGALVLVGLAVILRRRERLWLVALWAVPWAVFVGCAAFNNSLSRAVTGVWYNNSPRLAAITPVGTYLVATVGLVAVCSAVHRARRSLRPWVSSAVVIGLFVVGTGGNYVREHAARLHPYYHPYHSRDALLTPQGYAALRALAPKLPADALVADNPWRGTALLYALGGRRVLFYSQLAVNTADRTVIAADLDLAGSADRLDVCAAVRRTGIQYVIAGGTTFLPDHSHTTRFPGIDQVPGSPGFVEIASAAPYTLWKITACG